VPPYKVESLTTKASAAGLPLCRAVLTFADLPQIEGPTGRFMLSSREAIRRLRPAKVPTRFELTAMCRNLPSSSRVREAQFDRWAR
jgi:hypothetical protein